MFSNQLVVNTRQVQFALGLYPTTRCSGSICTFCKHACVFEVFGPVTEVHASVTKISKHAYNIYAHFKIYILQAKYD